MWLFVYGTLKRGFRNHGWLRGAAFHGEAQTSPGYALRSLGSYPGLTTASGDDRVSGELFAVSDALLAELDVLEGAEYRRDEIALASGLCAQAYVLVDPAAAPTVIPDGCWREPG